MTGANSVLEAPDFHTANGDAYLTVSQGGRLNAHRLGFAADMEAGSRSTAVAKDEGTVIEAIFIKLADISEKNVNMSSSLSVQSGARVHAFERMAVGKGGLLIVDANAPTDIQIGAIPLTSKPIDRAVHIMASDSGKPAGILDLVGGEVRSPSIQVHASPATGIDAGKMAGYGIIRHPDSDPVQVTNSGIIQTYGQNTVMPSSRNAELFINGDYTQTATGLLDVTLTPQHDISTSQYKTALDITGKATLDGTLNLRRKDNFIPDVGKSFSLMKWQEVQGRFSKMTGQDINGDRFSAWFTRTTTWKP